MGRLRLVALLLLGLAGGLVAAPQETDWSATWDELERVLAAPDAEGADAARARLAMTAAKEERDPRGRILATWLERAAGRELALELPLEEVQGLAPRAAWLAARVLAPGPALERALELALAGLADAEVGPCYQLAFERYVALADAYEAERAQALAAAMHARAGALWSAVNLATSLRRLGRFDEAYAALSAQLERAGTPAERAELLQSRALVDAGAGWEARARDDLGAALARGSVDAAVVLGRTALAEGRPERARAVLRSVLRTAPPQAWALRGWGLSMLPRARERL